MQAFPEHGMNATVEIGLLVTVLREVVSEMLHLFSPGSPSGADAATMMRLILDGKPASANYGGNIVLEMLGIRKASTTRCQVQHNLVIFWNTIHGTR